MTDDASPRTVTRADLETLAAIHGASFPDAPWDSAQLDGMLAMPGAFALMADKGFALLRVAADEAEVITIAVDPNARGQGLGRRLMVASLAQAARTGATVALLEVAIDNAAARALYQALDFAEVGRRRAYYRRADGGTADALIMSKSLVGQSKA